MAKQITRKTISAEGLTFRWRYIVLPVAVLLLSGALAVYFYRLLPAEVGYRFDAEGLPKSWLSPLAITSIMLAIQFFLVLLAGAITLGIIRMGRVLGQGDRRGIERVVLAMGNMVVLLQIVLAFVMADVFSYNAYDSHLMSVWLFALIVMVLGGVILAIFFIPAIRGSGAGGILKAIRSDLFDRTKQG